MMNGSNTKQNSVWLARDQQVLQHPGGGGGDDTVVLSHGQGSRLWDVDGREYLDAQAGAWLALVGHGRNELAEIGAAQMARLAHFSIGFDYTNVLKNLSTSTYRSTVIVFTRPLIMLLA